MLDDNNNEHTAFISVPLHAAFSGGGSWAFITVSKLKDNQNGRTQQMMKTFIGEVFRNVIDSCFQPYIVRPTFRNTLI